MQVLGSYTRPTESDTQGSGPSNPGFSKPSGNSEASSSLRTLAEWKKPGLGARRPYLDSSSGFHGPIQLNLMNSHDVLLQGCGDAKRS